MTSPSSSPSPRPLAAGELEEALVIPLVTIGLSRSRARPRCGQLATTLCCRQGPSRSLGSRSDLNALLPGRTRLPRSSPCHPWLLAPRQAAHVPPARAALAALDPRSWRAPIPP